MSAPLLSVRDLTVTFGTDGEERALLDAVSLDLGKGEVLGLVGESGSGKSLFCRSLVGLLPSRRMRIAGGSIRLGGRDLTRLDEAEMLKIRGGEIGMIFQNPSSHLDPVMRIGENAPLSQPTAAPKAAPAAKAEGPAPKIAGDSFNANASANDVNVVTFNVAGGASAFKLEEKLVDNPVFQKVIKGDAELASLLAMRHVYNAAQMEP